jgi:hypothetical protein
MPSEHAWAEPSPSAAHAEQDFLCRPPDAAQTDRQPGGATAAESSAESAADVASTSSSRLRSGSRTSRPGLLGGCEEVESLHPVPARSSPGGDVNTGRWRLWGLGAPKAATVSASGAVASPCVTKERSAESGTAASKLSPAPSPPVGNGDAAAHLSPSLSRSMSATFGDGALLTGNPRMETMGLKRSSSTGNTAAFCCLAFQRRDLHHPPLGFNWAFGRQYSAHHHMVV